MKMKKSLSGMRVVSGSDDWKTVGSEGSSVQVMKKYTLLTSSGGKVTKKGVKKVKGPVAPSLLLSSQAKQVEGPKATKKRKKKKQKKGQTEEATEGTEDEKATNQAKQEGPKASGKNNKKKQSKGPVKEATDGAEDEEGSSQAKQQGPKANGIKKNKKKQKKGKKKASKISEMEEEESQAVESKDMSAWDDMFVHPLVMKGLEEQGFACPTPIQRAVLPAATRGQRDVVGAAETGSGKTLAFAIPILNGILEHKEKEDDSMDGGSTGDGPSDGEEGDTASGEADSEEEGDFSDPDLEGVGCVKVFNDVKFDFDEDGCVFIPPPTDLPQADKEPAKATDNNRKLHALVLTPTRELAIQVKDHIVAAAKYTGIQTAVVVGGMAPQKQRRLLARRPEIVVGTPGRLWDLISESDSHLAGGVKDIRYLAIDETDRMVEKGHFEELQQLLEMINADEAKMSARQNFVFSATLSMVHDIPDYLMKKKKSKKLSPAEKLKGITSVIGVKDKAKVVDLTTEKGKGTADGLVESRIGCSITEKDYYLYYMLSQHPGRTLVFCNSIDCVRRLVNLFGYLRVCPLGLHAQMQQRQRLKNLDRFAKNPRGILIATDVAARGLDIKDVQHVIHYQVPRASENYVHRSGRTARASKEGISVMLIEPAENFAYKKLSRTLGRSEDEMPTFPVDADIFPQVKQRVKVARELDKLLLTSKKEKVEKSWFKKAAEEMDIELSDEDGDMDDESMRLEARKKELKRSGDTAAKQAELAALLDTPIIQAGFSGKYPTMTGRLEVPKSMAAAEPSATSAIDRLATEIRDSKKVLKSKPSQASLKNRRAKKKKKKSTS